MTNWAIDKKGRLFLDGVMVALIEEYDRSRGHDDEPELLIRTVEVMGLESYTESSSLADVERTYPVKVWQSHLITTTGSHRFESSEEHKKVQPPKGKKK